MVPIGTIIGLVAFRKRDPSRALASGLLQRPAGRALNVASPWQTQPTSCSDEP
jgi:hypothetical protein